MNEFIGKTVAGYQLKAEIGRGSLGTVFRAEKAAVKIVPLAELGAATAFAEQMAKVAALKHPRILELYDYGSEAGYAYLVMQLIEGGNTLAKLLQNGAMSRWKALEMIRQIAAALETAHAADVLHLNLKPGNVLLNDKNWPWVADFGLAAALGVDAPDSAYLAPEQLQGMPVDRRTDIYALGLLLYEMLTGAHPEISAGLPLSPHQVNPQIPESIAHVTLRALAPAPDDRYDSVAAFTEALKTATSDSSYRESVVEMLAAMPLAAAAVAAAEGIKPEAEMPLKEVEPAVEDIEPAAEVSETAAEIAPEDIEPVMPEQPVSEEPGVLIRLPKATGSVAKSAPPDAPEEAADDEGDSPVPEAVAAGVVAAGAVAALADGESPEAAEPSAAADEPEPEIEPEEPSAVVPLPDEKPMPRPEVIMTTAPPIVTPGSRVPPPLPPQPKKSGTSGPSEWKMPVWVTVLGLLLVAVIVVWIIFAMSFSDTGARLSATQTAEALAAVVPTATATPRPTDTPMPQPTDTPAPVATNTPAPEPSATSTPEPAPTDTPEPEPSPTDTPAPEPTATDTPEPTVTPPAGEWALLSPAVGDPATTGPTPFNFEWQWSEPLAPGQGFEIRVWRAGQGPQGAHDSVADNAAGLIKQLDETTYSFELDISNAANVQNVSSVYNWTVALVQLEPEYKDLGQQAEPGILQYIGTRGPEDIAPPAPEAPAESSPETTPAEPTPDANPTDGSGG